MECYNLPMIDTSAVGHEMRVIQSVAGTFHHFDLARELYAKGCLKKIYSTYRWKRLKRENIPSALVGTFPWIHPAMMLLQRLNIRLPQGIVSDASYANHLLFDSWVSRQIPECDVFIGISGSGLATGRVVQRRGAKYICDRGSSHIRYQDQILTEEYKRWGINEIVCDPRGICREEEEYSQADTITVPSEFARRSFLEMGVPAAKVHKIPYGVNLERFQPCADPDPKRFDILFAGQVSFRKGIPYLLQAFEKFSHPCKRLRIAGNVTREVQSLLDSKRSRNIEILGPVSQDRLKQLMSSSHVLVLPSLEEGLALVQGQAMACGCPVIGSTNTGGSDLFTPGVEGFEVPIRSADAIAERLQQLADDPELRQSMSLAALERVKSLGGWREYGDLYVNLLHQLIAGQITR